MPLKSRRVLDAVLSGTSYNFPSNNRVHLHPNARSQPRRDASAIYAYWRSLNTPEAALKHKLKAVKIWRRLETADLNARNHITSDIRFYEIIFSHTTCSTKTKMESRLDTTRR